VNIRKQENMTVQELETFIKKYGRSITFGEMKSCRTVGDLFNLLAGK